MRKGSGWERTKMFFSLVPLLILLFLFDFETYPLLNLLLAFLSAMASVEMNNLLKKSYSLSLPSYLAFLIGAYPVLVNYLLGLVGQSSFSLEFIVISLLGLIFILSLLLLSNKEITVNSLLNWIFVSSFLLIYPSSLFFFCSSISLLSNRAYIAILALMVFSNDSLAYVFGRLLGRYLPGSLKVSPNKTVMGFLGGIIGSLLSVILANIWGVFSVNFFSLIFLGIFMGVCVIMGDLLESAFKRKAGIKDSGNLIQGRGGILDSMDSFFFVAPIFYYLLVFWLQ